MNIFDQEKSDDLEDLILATPLVSIASQVFPAQNQNAFNKNLKSLASYDDEDLYYVQSILVTSSWNKNDDIFAKEEIWAAKNTPEDKPTNLEHDENTIIGHIVSNWSITDDGILIDSNTPIENLPEKFHIVTGSVIYKAYTNPDLKRRAQKLIEEIENGTKYVSMECMFKGFDYGLIDEKTGDYRVLPRSEDTAFLTKHLRSYGGNGRYENHKIGRVLRNITFSGKGYVNKPANPDSIIFNQNNFDIASSNKKNHNKSFSGVSKNRPNTTEVNNMSLEKEFAELKEKIEAMNDCVSATKEAYAEISELKSSIATLQNDLVSKSEQLNKFETDYQTLVSESEAAKKMTEEEMMKKDEDMKKAKSELDEVLEALSVYKNKEEEMMKKNEELNKTKSDLEEALQTIAVYKNKEEEMMKKEKNMKRMASLLESGLDQESASSAVDKFESLEDSVFENMVDLLANASKKNHETQAKKVESSQNQDESVLENAEVNNDLNLSVGSDSTNVEDEINSTRAALVDYVCSRLGTKLNKGE